MTPDGPTVRAAEIGREHGTRDARKWITNGGTMAPFGVQWIAGRFAVNPALPQPDLADDELDDTLGVLSGPIDGDEPTFPEVHEAYCAAYRAAVDETIRGEVTL